MTQIQSNNKRIARNTMLLYIRMFLSMAVSLYTSRVILQTLGVEDYGIYNVVGGVVGMFSFLNTTMSSATSRFLTYSLGEQNNSKLRDTFSASFWIHIIIAILVFLLCETIGLWFLTNKMVLPDDRLTAAHIVFQFSVLSTMISITQVPYNASLIAHEKMDVYAYVEMGNVVLRLLIVYALVLLPYDQLVTYSILLFLVSTSVAMYYRYYTTRHFEECHIQFKWQPSVVKPMLSFSGWDFFGNMAVTARTQGVSMLLNVFFGPVLNAAAGVASNVQNAVLAFANNVNTAVRPQIIKYHAQGEYSAMTSLINNSCKFNYMILLMITLPLCCEMDYVLTLWLGNVPDYAPIFCILTLIFNMIANLSYLVNTGNHAVGQIQKPSVINGALYICVIPLSYILYKMGGEPWVAYLFNAAAVFFGLLTNVVVLSHNCPEFSIWRFVHDVIAKCVLVTIISCVVVMLSTQFFAPSFFRLCLSTLISIIVVGITGLYILLTEGIRNKILTKIKHKL